MATIAAASKICALVPVKRLGWAKSRLAPHLTTGERNCLAEAMLRDVLDVLSKVPQLGGIAVITSDTAVASIANDYNAVVIDDLDDAGINNAVRRGQRALAAEGHAGVLVIPGDIPFLSAQEIELALSALADCNVVITPANRDGGTNLLGFSPPHVMDPSFGLHSFRRHLAIARAMGLEVVVLPLEGAGHDIDVPADLWSDTDGPAIQTRRLLARLGKDVPPACPGPTQEPLSP
ncbi:2-phospho-L-lactate guanylyltransferase (plasmid) [Aminobacter sp. BA135]|uniref:2-phospho-L-lactate guanylyltransferase n=1 Tax=Aminobacter sp. BA135 TaxID=537596 RepID=UPI003D7B3678